METMRPRPGIDYQPLVPLPQREPVLPSPRTKTITRIPTMPPSPEDAKRREYKKGSPPLDGSPKTDTQEPAKNNNQF